MHQRNHNHQLPHAAPTSTSSSLEDRRGGDFPIDQTAEGRPESAPDDWETDDPLIFFDGLDLEERRVELPCDDDGQVFLAPHRTQEALRHDSQAKLLSEKLEVTAKEVSSVESLAGDHRWSQGEFGFAGDGDHENVVEPILEPSLDLPVRKEDITDAFISLKVLANPGSQEPVPQEMEPSEDADEIDEIDQQLTLPSIEDPASVDVPTGDNAVASKPVPFIKTVVSGIVQSVSWLSRTAGRSLRVSAEAVVGRLLGFLTTVNQILRILALKAAKFAMLFGAGLAKAAQVACSLSLRFGRHAASRLHVASMLFMRMLSRFWQWLTARSVIMASASRIKMRILLTALGPWSSAVGKAYLNDIKIMISLSKRGFNLLKTRVIRLSNNVGRSLADTSYQLGRTFNQTSQVGSVVCHAALDKSVTAIGKASQFLSVASVRAWEAMQQKLGRHASQGVLGSAFITKVVQNNLMAAGHGLKRSMGMSLGGVAGAAAVVVLLMATLDDASTSKTPSITLAFPPKPSGNQSELSDDPIIFDWPAIDVPQNETKSIEIDDHAAKAEPFSTEDEPAPSPEAISVDPIEDVTLVGNSSIAI